MSADPVAKEQKAKENRKARKTIRIMASHRGSLIIKIAMGMKKRVLPNAKDDIVTGAKRHTRATAGRFATIVEYAIIRSQDVENLEDDVSDMVTTHDETTHPILEDVATDRMIIRDEDTHLVLTDDGSNGMITHDENTHLILKDDRRVRMKLHGRQRMCSITVM
jgi:hypothetical protein